MERRGKKGREGMRSDKWYVLSGTCGCMLSPLSPSPSSLAGGAEGCKGDQLHLLLPKWLTAGHGQ